jgi:4-methyl-5(b-hydroxyethyl)-thiazole monophosphate biosynthesis
MSRVLVPLAPGFEEIEAVTVVDLLRRAGIEVHTASLEGPQVTGSHGITVVADVAFDAARDGNYDMIVLPGGMPGAQHLGADPRVISLLRRMAADRRYLAAICAAPSVLARAGLLAERAATSFPGFLDADSAPGIQLRDDAVVVDGRVVTSRGAGTAMEFGLVLIELLEGATVREQVQARLQLVQGGR